MIKIEKKNREKDENNVAHAQDLSPDDLDVREENELTEEQKKNGPKKDKLDENLSE